MAISEIAGASVSRETIEKLQALVALIEKWTKSINLIANASVPDIWSRHIIDSAQLYQHAKPNWTNWTDLGSGGGLPGLVIAIMREGKDLVTLVESDTRKCLFLNTARRELELNVDVQNARIEAIDAPTADIISARALAPLPELLKHTQRLLQPSGTAFFPKGAKYQEELDDARKTWQFDVAAHESITNPDARVLEISRIFKRES